VVLLLQAKPRSSRAIARRCEGGSTIELLTCRIAPTPPKWNSGTHVNAKLAPAITKAASAARCQPSRSEPTGQTALPPNTTRVVSFGQRHSAQHVSRIRAKRPARLVTSTHDRECELAGIGRTASWPRFRFRPVGPEPATYCVLGARRRTKSRSSVRIVTGRPDLFVTYCVTIQGRLALPRRSTPGDNRGEGE
jgi:hypothetical protein